MLKKVIPNPRPSPLSEYKILTNFIREYKYRQKLTDNHTKFLEWIVSPRIGNNHFNLSIRANNLLSIIHYELKIQKDGYKEEVLNATLDHYYKEYKDSKETNKSGFNKKNFKIHFNKLLRALKRYIEKIDYPNHKSKTRSNSLIDTPFLQNITDIPEIPLQRTASIISPSPLEPKSFSKKLCDTINKNSYWQEKLSEIIELQTSWDSFNVKPLQTITGGLLLCFDNHHINKFIAGFILINSIMSMHRLLRQCEPILEWIKQLPKTATLHIYSKETKHIDLSKPLLVNIQDILKDNSKNPVIALTSFGTPIPIALLNHKSCFHIPAKSLIKDNHVTPLLQQTLNKDHQHTLITPFTTSLLCYAIITLIQKEPTITESLLLMIVLANLLPNLQLNSNKCPYSTTVLTEKPFSPNHLKQKKVTKSSLKKYPAIIPTMVLQTMNHKTNGEKINLNILKNIVSALLNAVIIGNIDVDFKAPDFVTEFIDEQANPRIFTDPLYKQEKANYFRKEMIEWATKYFENYWQELTIQASNGNNKFSHIKQTFSLQFPDKTIPDDWSEFKKEYLDNPIHRLDTEQWLLGISFLFIASHETTAAILNNVLTHLLYTQKAQNEQPNEEPLSIDGNNTEEGFSKGTTVKGIPDSIPEQFKETYKDLATKLITSINEDVNEDSTLHKFEAFKNKLQNFIAFMFFIFPPIPITAHQTTQPVTVAGTTIPSNISLILPIQNLAQQELKEAIDNKETNLWNNLLLKYNHILFGIQQRPCWGRQFVLGDSQTMGELMRLAIPLVTGLIKGIDDPNFTPQTTVEQTPTLRGPNNEFTVDRDKTIEAIETACTLLNEYLQTP